MPISKNHKKNKSHWEWKKYQNIKKAKRRYSESPKRYFD